RASVRRIGEAASGAFRRRCATGPRARARGAAGSVRDRRVRSSAVTAGSTSPRRGSRREQLELGGFLLLIVPPIVLASMSDMSRHAFAITTVATILHDVALTALILFFVWNAGEPFAAIGWTTRRMGREIALGVVLYLPMLAVLVVVGSL